jgi:hypothetical protein
MEGARALKVHHLTLAAGRMHAPDASCHTPDAR